MEEQFSAGERALSVEEMLFFVVEGPLSVREELFCVVENFPTAKYLYSNRLLPKLLAQLLLQKGQQKTPCQITRS